MSNARSTKVAFTADKNGRPVAYLWSGFGYAGCPLGRWIRIGHDDAKVRIATGVAVEVPYAKREG